MTRKQRLLAIIKILSLVITIYITPKDFKNCVNDCKNTGQNDQYCVGQCRHKHWGEMQAALKTPACHEICKEFQMPDEWCSDWSTCGPVKNQAKSVDTTPLSPQEKVKQHDMLDLQKCYSECKEHYGRLYKNDTNSNIKITGACKKSCKKLEQEYRKKAQQGIAKIIEIGRSQETHPGTYRDKQNIKKEPKETRIKVAQTTPVSPGTVTKETKTDKTNNKKIIGYFANWAIYSRNYHIKDIPADKLTHINYAFAKNDANGNIDVIDSHADIDDRDDWNTQKPYWGNFKRLQDLKKRYPHVKTLISIGGWTLSDTFSPMASNVHARRNFALNAVNFARRYGFDGIDIDWEYPGYNEHKGKPEDTKNFTLLLKNLREAIAQEAANSGNQKLLLTIAAPAGIWHLQNMEIDKIHNYLDWINVMTYDFHGPWGPSANDDVTNHLAPLYPSKVGDKTLNVQSAVNYYIAKGVPREKIVVGIPLYGRTYAQVQAGDNGDGLFSTYSGKGSGIAEKGMRLLGDIEKNLLNAGYKRYWDDFSKVPYLYNHNNKEFVSYDDSQSLAHKAHFAKDNNLGGIMIWELDKNIDLALDAIKDALS